MKYNMPDHDAPARAFWPLVRLHEAVCGGDVDAYRVALASARHADASNDEVMTVYAQCVRWRLALGQGWPFDVDMTGAPC